MFSDSHGCSPPPSLEIAGCAAPAPLHGPQNQEVSKEMGPHLGRLPGHQHVWQLQKHLGLLLVAQAQPLRAARHLRHRGPERQPQPPGTAPRSLRSLRRPARPRQPRPRPQRQLHGPSAALEPSKRSEALRAAFLGAPGHVGTKRWPHQAHVRPRNRPLEGLSTARRTKGQLLASRPSCGMSPLSSGTES